MAGASLRCRTARLLYEQCVSEAQGLCHAEQSHSGKLSSCLEHGSMFETKEHSINVCRLCIAWPTACGLATTCELHNNVLSGQHIWALCKEPSHGAPPGAARPPAWPGAAHPAGRPERLRGRAPARLRPSTRGPWPRAAPPPPSAPAQPPPAGRRMWLSLSRRAVQAWAAAWHDRAAHIQQEPFVDVIYDAVDGALLGAGEVCKGQHGARVVAHRNRLGVDALVTQRRANVELAKHLRVGIATAKVDAASIA